MNSQGDLFDDGLVEFEHHGTLYRRTPEEVSEMRHRAHGYLTDHPRRGNTLARDKEEAARLRKEQPDGKDFAVETQDAGNPTMVGP